MPTSQLQRRAVIFGSVIAVLLGALSYRLADLQLLRHEQLQKKALNNTHKTIVREPMRGQIRDRRENPLATSVAAKVLCADPTLIGARTNEVARLLAPFLETNEASIVTRLMPRPRADGKPSAYVVLKRKVPVETWERIHAAMTNLSFGINEKKLKKDDQAFYNNLRQEAIFSQEDHIRVYPNLTLASHVLGYIGNEDDPKDRAGIEARMEPFLAGVRGWRRTEMDNKHRELVVYREQDVEPRDGLNVVLTIDSDLQYYMETEIAAAFAEHQPQSITAVAVRPATGEILAMANLPTFNPNHPTQSKMEDRRNRAVTDAIEPGSTFKIVVISAALNENLVKMTDKFFCETGAFHFAGTTLHDHVKLGELDVEHIITKSSNIGAAKVGIQLGESRLSDYIHAYGFGASTSIPLPGESWGRVAPVAKWTKVSIAQIPMGQGISVTPLQITMAMSAIANEGKLMRPMLVHHLEDSEGRIVERVQPQLVRQVIRPDVARQMVEALKTVCTPEGTAVKARMANYVVAGKTGTAQLAIPGGYASNRYISSFIGFFPADRPEVCISVIMVDPKEGHYGGDVSAPVFKNIAEKMANYLNIRPDPMAFTPGMATVSPR